MPRFVNWHIDSGEKDSLFRQCIFAISLLFHLGNRHGPLYDKIRIPLTQGCFVPRQVEIGPGSREDVYYISLMRFHHIISIPLGKGRDPSFEKLEFHSFKDVLWHVCT